ncbi:37653_t:CDS:2, partial [Gigaspora margarita]
CEQREVNNRNNLLVIEGDDAAGYSKITQFFSSANNLSFNNEVTKDPLNSESDYKEEKWEQNLQETEERIQNLIDTTEMLKTNKVKYISIIYYIRLIQRGSSKTEASQVVATIHNGGVYHARCIRSWGKRCLEGNLLPPSQYGKHLSQSLLHDKDVSLKITNYLRATKFKVNPRLVKQYFENNILPELQIDIVQTNSLTTAWQPNLLPGEQKHILITHDECTFHFYDGTHEFWALESEQSLRKKRLEKGLHISEFLVKTIGKLKDEKGEVGSIIQLDVNNDGYWNGEKLLSQVKNALLIFEKTHPGCVGIWAFDNATIDCCTLHLLAN